MLSRYRAEELFADLLPRQILQLMMQYTVQAAYAEPLLHHDINHVEQFLFPASLVAQGFYYSPRHRHQASSTRAKVYLGAHVAQRNAVDDDHEGRLLALSNAILLCIQVGDYLQGAFEDNWGARADISTAVVCLKLVMPLLGFGMEELEGAVEALQL